MNTNNPPPVFIEPTPILPQQQSTQANLSPTRPPLNKQIQTDKYTHGFRTSLCSCSEPGGISLCLTTCILPCATAGQIARSLPDGGSYCYGAGWFFGGWIIAFAVFFYGNLDSFLQLAVFRDVSGQDCVHEIDIEMCVDVCV